MAELWVQPSSVAPLPMLGPRCSSTVRHDDCPSLTKQRPFRLPCQSPLLGASENAALTPASCPHGLSFLFTASNPSQPTSTPTPSTNLPWPQTPLGTLFSPAPPPVVSCQQPSPALDCTYHVFAFSMGSCKSEGFRFIFPAFSGRAGAQWMCLEYISIIQFGILHLYELLGATVINTHFCALCWRWVEPGNL